ncbi:MAG: hypothetical protein P8X63_05595 [Desulfuromonadaceae bacterium]|jgi:hypothetical protein
MNNETLIWGMQGVFFGSALVHLCFATFLWETVSKRLLHWYFQKVIARIEQNRLSYEAFENKAKKFLYSTIVIMFSVGLFLLTDTAKEQIGMYFGP